MQKQNKPLKANKEKCTKRKNGKLKKSKDDKIDKKSEEETENNERTKKFGKKIHTSLSDGDSSSNF